MKKYKFERREDKLNNRRRQSNAVKVDIPNLSKKDIIIVTVEVDGDTKNPIKVRLSGKGLVGHRKEFETGLERQKDHRNEK